MKSRQTGVTLIGFLIILAVVGFFGYMAMKLVPSYTEYMGVVKAMNQIATDGASGKTLNEIRHDLMFKMDFQYVDDATVSPKDITITHDRASGSTGTELNVTYDKRVPFVYNIDFLLHFDKSVPLQDYMSQ